MNKIFITGYLGKSPELKYSQDGKAFCHISVGSSDGYGDKAKTTWFKCVAFGKSGEAAEKHLDKGSPITIIGRMESNTYDKSDGTKGYSMDVIIDSWEFALRGKADRADAERGDAYEAPAANTNTAKSKAPKKAEPEPEPEVVDEWDQAGLPF